MAILRPVLASITLSLALLAMVTTLAGATSPIAGSRFKSGNWTGRAYTDEKGFTHCTISASYRSGITMHFAIDREYLWRIGFSHDDWELDKGDTFDILYKIDRHKAISAKAKVVSPKLVMAELIAKSYLFNQFRRGRTLRVKVDDKVYAFSLKGTSRALVRVLSCVKRNIDYVPPARIARQPKEPMAPARTSKDDIVTASPEDMLAATRYIVRLFSATDFTGYTLLDEETMSGPDSPKFFRSAAAGWRTGEMIGTLHVLNAKAITTAEALAGLIANDAKACPGSFASGSKKSEIDERVLTGFTACREEDSYKFYVDYLLFPQPRDKLYLISNRQFNREEVDQSMTATLARNVAMTLR